MKRLAIAVVVALVTLSAWAAAPVCTCTFDGAGTGPSGKWTSCTTAECTFTAAGGFDGRASLMAGAIGSGVGLSVPPYPPGVFLPLEINLATPLREMTIVWSSKFDDNDGNIGFAGGGVKEIRPFFGSDRYIGAIVSQHGGGQWYMSGWETADLHVTSKVTDVTDECENLGYCNCATTPSPCCTGCTRGPCSPISPNDYNCDRNTAIGELNSRMRVRWSPGFGDNVWRKIRLYIKNALNDSTYDGEVRLWIDEEEMYRVTNIRRSAGSACVPACSPSEGNTTYRIRWFPQEDANESYVHGLDEVSLYSGLVPPGLSPPTNLTSPYQGPVEIGLAWTDNSAEETNYRVQRRKVVDPPGEWVTAANLPADATSHADDPGAPGFHEYRVYCCLGGTLCSGSIDSEPSNTVTASRRAVVVTGGRPRGIKIFAQAVP